MLRKEFVHVKGGESGITLLRIQQLLTGAKEMFPRWRRCLTETDVDIGEALGQAYVEQSFTPQAKARALAMVQNLTAALRDRLNTLSWIFGRSIVKTGCSNS